MNEERALNVVVVKTNISSLWMLLTHATHAIDWKLFQACPKDKQNGIWEDQNWKALEWNQKQDQTLYEWNNKQAT